MFPNMVRRDDHLLTVPPQELHHDAVHVFIKLGEQLTPDVRRVMLGESQKLVACAKQPGMTPDMMKDFVRLGFKQALPNASEDQLRALTFLALMQALRVPAPPLPEEANKVAMDLLTFYMGSILPIAQTDLKGVGAA